MTGLLRSCDDCGAPVATKTGCFHDGRAWCSSCLHNCPDCAEAIRLSDARAAVRLQPVRRPGIDLRPRRGWTHEVTDWSPHWTPIHSEEEDDRD